MLATRLSGNEIVTALVTSYLVFFSVGFGLVGYCVAFCQQFVLASHTVNWTVFVLKALDGIFGFGLFWIIVGAWVVVRIRNEFTALFTLTVLYAISQIANFATRGALFDQLWLARAFLDENLSGGVQAGCLWLISVGAAVAVGRFLGGQISQVEFSEPYHEGILARMSRLLGLDLSMHHYKMMGLTSQKILMIFSAAWLILIIALARNPVADLSVLTKLYLGAVLPLMFSFNQYFLVKIDIDAGMTHNNFLRQLSYARIVFNRWLALLIPQLLVAVLSCVILSVTVTPLPLSFVVYVLVLNVFCSIANFFFAVSTQTNAIANLFLFFFVYLQLREDMQATVFSRPWLRQLNVFSPLLQDGYAISWSQWITVSGVVLLICVLTNLQLGRIRYVDLEVD